MTRTAPRPIIAQVVQTWRLIAGMTFALARDIEGRLWIVESCPAGTRFWTPEQAAMLSQGRQTGFALQAALRRAAELSAAPAPRAELEKDYTLTDTVKALLESVEKFDPMQTPQTVRPLRAERACLRS